MTAETMLALAAALGLLVALGLFIALRATCAHVNSLLAAVRNLETTAARLEQQAAGLRAASRGAD